MAASPKLRFRHSRFSGQLIDYAPFEAPSLERRDGHCSDGHSRKKRTKNGCLYRKSDSAIMVMKSAEDGRRYDVAHVLDGAMDWSVFVERPISPQLDQDA
jgi:hypothetical protein